MAETPPDATHPSDSKDSKLALVVMAVYLLLLLVATIGELFEIGWILDRFS